MALGVLTLPSVGTSFATSESKALVPYSPPSIGSAKTMSPIESLTEVFYEIRDGINNLGEIFKERISGLNSHLAFRLEDVSFHLNAISHNIGAMAYMQEQKLQITEDREAERDRGESLDDAEGVKGETGGGKLGWLDTLKDAFGRSKDAFGNIGTKMKLLLLAAGLLALNKYTEEILPKLEIVLEKMKKLSKWFKKEVVDEETGEVTEEWDMTKVTGVGLAVLFRKRIFNMLKGLTLSAAKHAPKLLTAFRAAAPWAMRAGAVFAGPAGVAAFAVFSAFQIAGDAAAAADWTEEMGATDSEKINKFAGGLGGKLEGGIGNAFKKAGDWAWIGAAAGIPFGPPGMIIGGVIGGAIGGILGWIGGGKIARATEWVVDGFNNLVDNIKIAISDIFYDREIATADGTFTQRSKIGKIKDRMDKVIEDLGNWLYDGKGVIMGIDFSKFAENFPTLKELSDGIMDSLPDWMTAWRKTEEEKAQKLKVEELEEADVFNKDWATKSEIDRDKIKSWSSDHLRSLLAVEGDDMHQEDIDYIKAILTARGEGERKFDMSSVVNYPDQIQMIAKTKELKAAAAEGTGNQQIPISPITIMDNKSSSSNIINEGDKLLVPISVNHPDAATNAILQNKSATGG